MRVQLGKGVSAIGGRCATALNVRTEVLWVVGVVVLVGGVSVCS